MTAAEWTGPECFMCNGTGRDRTAVTEPHGPFARVVGHVENWRPCRACNGHGRDSAGGEIPAAATESAPVSGVASGKMALDIEAAPASAQTLPRPRPTASLQATRSDVQA